MSTSSGADGAVIEHVHRDLLALATWLVIRGRADEPLVRVEVEDGSPEDAQEAAVRLNAITARDLLPGLQIADPVDELAAVVAGLDDRQLALLLDRLFADKPVVLDELGAASGVAAAAGCTPG